MLASELSQNIELTILTGAYDIEDDESRTPKVFDAILSDISSVKVDPILPRIRLSLECDPIQNPLPSTSERIELHTRFGSGKRRRGR